MVRDTLPTYKNTKYLDRQLRKTLRGKEADYNFEEMEHGFIVSNREEMKLGSLREERQ